MKKHQFVIFFISGSIIATVLVLAYIFFYTNHTKKIVSLPEDLEIADTNEKRALGLSFREHLSEDYGMLFIFHEAGVHGFWMKDMWVSIDMIWIDAKGKIVHVDDWVSPDTYPTIFYPPSPIQYVLETKGGEAERLGLEEGASVPLLCMGKK